MPAVRLEEEEGVGVGRGRKAFLFRLHYLKGKRRAVSGTGGNSGDPETFLMCLFTQKMLTTEPYSEKEPSTEMPMLS